MSNTDIDYDALGYVKSSKYRIAAVEALAEKPQIPKEIVESSDIDYAKLSRALNELTTRGVTELLVDEDTKKGRIYGLTESGEKIAEHIRGNDG